MCLGIPGRVIEISGEDYTRTATVDFDGVSKEVNVVFVPDVEIGDYVVVHVGFAITRLDESAAKETLELLHQREVVHEELDPSVALAAEQSRAGDDGS